MSFSPLLILIIFDIFITPITRFFAFSDDGFRHADISPPFRRRFRRFCRFRRFAMMLLSMMLIRCHYAMIRLYLRCCAITPHAAIDISPDYADADTPAIAAMMPRFTAFRRYAIDAFS